ncbi:MAG TPA: hypothetical protein VLC29_03620 [Rhizomicrobium sp.]|nr:hypothetical protein [Rhizomicrobium sp.]
MTDALPPPNDPHLRWKFLRDVLVFQLKLILGNLQNFVLVPVSLVAAALDLFIKGNREGEKFYKVMDWGRRTDEMINVYSAIGGYHATGDEDEKDMYGNYTVDAVLARVENVIVREYQKGGTAASIKGAVDSAIDGMQAHGGKHKEKIDEAMQRTDEAIRRATDKFKPKSDFAPDKKDGDR